MSSRAVTTTAGAMELPAVVAVGCVVNASPLGEPAATSNAVLEAPPRPDADAASVYPVPVLASERFVNVATPATAGVVLVPSSVAPPGLLANPTVTLPVNDVATLPKASRTVTRTAGAIAVPATLAPGCTVNANADAAAELVRVARGAFLAGVRVCAAISVAGSLALAVFVLARLRGIAPAPHAGPAEPARASE